MKNWLSVYVINLDSDVERFEHMRTKLQSMGIDFKRVPAVNGRCLNEDQKQFHNSGLRHRLSGPEVGCLLSHIEVWRQIASGDRQFGLVLEDDMHFSPSFKTFLTDLEGTIDANELCIHKLETFFARVTLDRDVRYEVGGSKCSQLFTTHAGTGCYLVNKNTAEFLLQQSSNFAQPVDIELFDMHRRQSVGLTVLQWSPALCIQDEFCVNKLGFESSIGDGRFDVVSGISAKNPLVERFKDTFRGLYTSLYSAVLFFKGKRRCQIDFDGVR